MEQGLTGKDIGFEAGSFWADAPVISKYTRAQAIEDGVLVDVSKWATQFFKHPVAITDTAWALFEEDGNPDFTQFMVWMALFHAKEAAFAAMQVTRELTQVTFLTTTKDWHQITLKMVCGGGDDGEPVLTIMLPEED